MALHQSFSLGGSDNVAVFEELRSMEPIFHTAAFGTTAADFERRMAADYWEVGASGRRYTREFILEHLERNSPVDAEAAGWVVSDCDVRGLAEDTYLFTYTLEQGNRVSRRGTIWRKAAVGWQIVYHQGTVVAG